MKESDPIKNFIDQNREDFDDKKVPAGLWDEIEARLPEQKTEKLVPLKTVLRIAAAIVVLFILGAVAMVLLNNERGIDSKPVAEAEQVPTEADIYSRYPELGDAAFFYTSRIQNTQEELAAFQIDEDDYESLKILEEELNELKRELGDEADSERLIQAMMQIYKYKLDMLESMLDQVKGTKNENTDSDEVQVVTL